MCTCEHQVNDAMCLRQARCVSALILQSYSVSKFLQSCHAGPMGMTELLSMAVEILEGLVQLHAIHVWHLDLKPANILLDEHHHAYLADFGISYALANPSELHSLDWLGWHPTLHVRTLFCTHL